MNEPGSVTVEPADRFNRELVENVHPPDWKNPEPADRYDMVVIGAGTAGLVTAAAMAGLGRRVALVERSLMGGDCLNVGCVPSKALLRAARAAAEVRSAERFGLRVAGDVQVDFAAVMERMRRLRSRIAPHDGAARFRELGVDVFLGNGRFAAFDAVTVEGATLRFRKACIATGGRPAVPPIPGLEQAGYLTNETVFSLTELPRRLAVIGAGPIGCELAQAFARFGAEVWLVEATHGILPREDRDAAGIVERSLRRDGVELLCCGQRTRLERIPDGKRLSLVSHGDACNVTVDEVLVAAGRRANVEGLDLETAGVEYDDGGVIVDDSLRTTNRKVFAAGDVCFRYKFTHAADANARVVVRNALLGPLPIKARAASLVVPWCTYTAPEVAHVGANPGELENENRRFDTVEIEMKDVDRAVLDGDEDGLLKVHVDRRGRILGATLVGRHAGESIGEIVTAMVHGIRLHGLSKVIHPYPTQAEAIKKAGDQYMRRRLIALKDRLLSLSGRRRSG